MSLVETEDIMNLLPNVHSGWNVYGGAVAVDDKVVELHGGRARAIMTINESSYKSTASCLTIYIRYWEVTNPNTYVRVQYNSKVYLFQCSKTGADGELYFFEVPMEAISGNNQFPSMSIGVDSNGGEGRVYVEVAFRRNTATEVDVATDQVTGIVRPNTSWGMKVATETDEEAGILVGDIGPNLSDQFEIDTNGQIRIKDGAVGGGGTQVTSIETYIDGFSYNGSVGFQTLANGNIIDLTTGTTITYTTYTDSILNHLTGEVPPPAVMSATLYTRYLTMTDTMAIVAAAGVIQTVFTANGTGTFTVSAFDIVDSDFGWPSGEGGGNMYISVDGAGAIELQETKVYEFKTSLVITGYHDQTVHEESGASMMFYFEGVLTTIAYV